MTDEPIQEEQKAELPKKLFRYDSKTRDQVIAIDPVQIGEILQMSMEITSGDYEGEIEGIAFKSIVPRTAIALPGQKPQGIPHVLLQIKWKKKGGVIQVVNGKLPSKST
ncbi:MAG: hypothetical protein WC479_07570 [Candidatus Izemoplasmatales bacterium]|jgi:hypothetical protein